MPRQRIEKLGSLGLNSDIWPTLLPPEAWSAMSNVATKDGSLVTVVGEKKLFDLAIRPVFHCPFIDDTVQKLIVSDGVRVHAYTMDGQYDDITPDTSHSVATPGDYPWNGGRITAAPLNTVLVLNSVTDGPYYWGGGNAKLAPLPGWGEDWRCGYMMAYKYYLVAMNMTETAGGFIHKIRWSGSAAEGELPTVWVAALSNDAGDDLLGESDGAIIGGVLSRDVAYIIKEDAIYSLQYVGGTFVMQTTRLRGGTGTAISGGFAEMRGAVAVFTADDLLLFDGQNSNSMADQRVRTAMKNMISPEYWSESKLFVHYPSSTLYVLGVGGGHNRLSDALLYNWEEDTWAIRKLQECYGFDQALIHVVSGGMPQWDELGSPGQNPLWQMGGTWDDQKIATWNTGVYQPTTPDLITYESNDIDDEWWVSAVAVSNSNWDGSAKYCFAERQNVPIEGADGMAMVTRAWVELEGNIPVNFYIGGQSANDAAPKWQGPYTVLPYGGTPQSFACRVTGKYVGWRVESTEVGRWALSSITLDWSRAGER